jgi:hypothetical protein
VSLWHDDFKAAGWLSYRDSLKDRDAGFYQGSWQKRVRDENGTRYFINVNLWHFPAHPDDRKSAAAEVQFSEVGEERNVVNVTPLRTFGSIDEIEAYFADVWAKLGLGYYERDVRSPLPLSEHGRGM